MEMKMFKIEFYNRVTKSWEDAGFDCDDVDDAIELVRRSSSEMNGRRYRVVSFTIYWESP